MWRFVRHHRHYFIYVPLSVTVAISLPMLISALADKAPGTGSQGRPKSADAGLLDRLGSALENLGNGLVGMGSSVIEWVARWIVDPVVQNPLVAGMGLLGALVGIVLARRKRHRRHRHHHRSRHHRVEGSGTRDAPSDDDPDHEGP